MVLYRGKYDLRGLSEITPEMEKDLDIAFEICEDMKKQFPCEMCGKCCHQPNIIIKPDEVDRISSAADVNLQTFITKYLVKSGNDLFIRKSNHGPCPFLKENECSIWKSRPEICDDFPYMVSMLMSRVYLAIVNDDADILEMISYMDDDWPCTKEIKSVIQGKIEEARKLRNA